MTSPRPSVVDAQSLGDLVAAIYQASGTAGSSLFLPTVVLEQWPSADPWTLPTLSFGDLAGLDATLPAALCNAISATCIASPPSAVMTLTGLTISGLADAVLAQPTVTGSNVAATVGFGGATVPPGLSLANSISITANFGIALSCCASQDGQTCSASSQPSPVSGSVTLTFTDASATFGLSVSSSNTVTANSIAFSAMPGSVAFQISTPVAAGLALTGLLNAAFATTAGTTAILSVINSALAADPALAALGAALTPRLQSIANPTLLSFVASQLYKAASDPTNSLYLPDQVQDATDPTLDPYTVSGTWDLGDVSSFYPAMGMTICGSIGATQGTNDIATPGAPIDLTLSDIVIAGLSNILAFPLLTVGNDIDALVVFGQVASWPRQFTVSGNFTMSLSCCVTTDFTTCSGPPQPQVGTGTFSATIAASSASANLTMSADGNQLIATLNGLHFRADPNAINPANFVFDIDITSVPADQQAVWNAQAEKLFDSGAATAAIVGQIQVQMNQSDVLQQISQIITNAIASVITQDSLNAILEQVRQTQPSAGRKQ